MVKERKKLWVIAIFLLFIIYFFAAARPIPPETVLSLHWLSPLESDTAENTEVTKTAVQPNGLIPFTLGSRFGYIDTEGHLRLNKIKYGEIYLSEYLWTEYEAEPDNIEIMNNAADIALILENPGGYPILLDNRIFILGSGQNSLSEIDTTGSVLWTYDFAAPLTCIDAAAGLVLAGSIDGVIEVLDNNGKRIFFFVPGGSRYEVILGCALSQDGQRVGIISGIAQQRFLLLEHYDSGEYKVIYHEFLEAGFRRPVHISFFDQDRRVAFECTEGISLFEIKSRRAVRIALNGELAAIDKTGSQGYFFLICSPSDEQKELIGIKLSRDRRKGIPGTVDIRAPFKSEGVYLGRTDTALIIGGGSTLLSFNLEKK
ncbi:MAG: WD40 repeat domain-containing protein [Treponema sp.]|nr:WD40 repeat domain-containing protein [Treponema sp.]